MYVMAFCIEFHRVDLFKDYLTDALARDTSSQSERAYEFLFPSILCPEIKKLIE